MWKAFFGKIGRDAGFLFSGTARLGTMFAEVTKYFLGVLVRPRTLPRETFAYQLTTMGIDSVGIISLVGASVGAVLALQAAYSLKDFGALNYTGSLVCVAMARELGPLIADCHLWPDWRSYCS